jgi:hypothetical protein
MRFYVTLILGTLLACGCGGKTENDYKPTATAARDALSAGLTAWKEGKGAADVAAASGPPVIRFADYQWTGGKKLASFRVLEETPTLEASTQRFRVELELAGEKPQAVEYYVVGIDPLWIMRDRDYQQTSMQ